MITFDPQEPWEVGQRVTFRNDKLGESVHVVESVEKSEDGNETQYHFVTERVWELRQVGVRPYIELD